MKIAIVKTSALGDIIHSGFILQFIKQKIPSVQIDWIIEAKFAPILEHNRDIHSILPIDISSIKKNYSQIFKQINLIRSYACNDYDIVIDLQGLIKSSIVSRILGKKVAGYDKTSIREGAASTLYHKKYAVAYDQNTIDRYRLLVAQALEITITPEEVLAKKPYLHYLSTDFEPFKNFFSSEKPNVIFIIGSTWPSRIYPKEQLLEIAQALPINILIPFGNAEEKADAEFLAQYASNVTVLPKMNLNQLKAVISHADLLIGNDTGPSYIAWANNIPSITLFGPTPPTRIYETPINKVLKSSSIVNPYKLDKNDFSIHDITVHTIIQEAQTLLQ